MLRDALLTMYDSPFLKNVINDLLTVHRSVNPPSRPHDQTWMVLMDKLLFCVTKNSTISKTSTHKVKLNEAHVIRLTLPMNFIVEVSKGKSNIITVLTVACD